MAERSDMAEGLIGKIRSGRATVAVAGLGYVGLPMALHAAEKFEHVVGIDVDAERVQAIRDGRSYVDDVPDERLRQAVADGRFETTADYAAVADCDMVLICVPTPLRKTGEPDISFIIASCEAISGQMAPGKLIVLESTSYPGTTEEEVRPRLERGGLRAGTDFFLAFSPERIDPATQYTDWDIENVPKVVGGVTEACTRVAAAFYECMVESVVPVRSSRVAEMVKLLENTYRSVNIAMVNEMALMCRELDVDVWEVVEAAGTKPFGFQAFYPGPGLGGHCLPVDPFYLAWKARLVGFEPRFIDLAGHINMSMPRHVVHRIFELLNGAGKPLRGSKVYVLGVAYKRNVSDVRESPALAIIEDLIRLGARVTYTDTHVPVLSLPGGAELRSVPVAECDLPACDCAVILTDHSDLPWERIAREAPLIFDTRNALKDYAGDHIHKL